MQLGAARVANVGELLRTVLESVDHISGVQRSRAALQSVRRSSRRVSGACANKIATVSRLVAKNGEGATHIAEAAREQAETLAEIERAAAPGEVSERLNAYSACFSAMTWQDVNAR